MQVTQKQNETNKTKIPIPTYIISLFFVAVSVNVAVSTNLQKHKLSIRSKQFNYLILCLSGGRKTKIKGFCEVKKCINQREDRIKS